MSTKLMKLVKSCAVFAACAFTAFTVSADTATEKVGDYTWTYSISGSEATISTGTYNQMAISPNPTGTLVIPATLGGKSVRTLGTGAFWDAGVTGITRWNYIKTISSYAFAKSRVTTMTLPDAITSVGQQAFWNCPNLTALKIGTGVTSIPKNFASSCSKLSNLTIGPNVTTIGEYAFASTAITMVIIPDKVTTIGTKAFNACSKLKVAYLPISLMGKITESDIFVGCASGFRVVYYGTSANAEYTYKFLLDGGKVELYDIDGGIAISPDPVGSLSIPETIYSCPVTTIGDGAFYGCSGLTSVTIPNNVTTIGSSAFAETGLTSVSIWGTVTSIGQDAFYGCANLKDVKLPEAMVGKFTQADLFSNCSSDIVILFRTSTLGKYAQLIGDRCWYFDNHLSTVVTLVAPGVVPATGDVTLPTKLNRIELKTIEANAFAGLDQLTHVTIPEGITTINNRAFEGCNGIEWVEIPSSVTTMNAAFVNCTGLQRVYLHESGLTASSAFFGCTSLSYITFPPAITRISGNAFQGCTSLKEITIPDGVTAIDWMAFYDCSGLESVTMPIGLYGKFVYDQVFSGNPKSMKIWYSGSAEVDGRTWFYRTSEELLEGEIGRCEVFNTAGIAIDPSEITSGSTFSVPGELDGLAVVGIGDWAFNETHMGALLLPDSVTTIGEGALYGCTLLSSVKIPPALKSIGERAFQNCTKLGSFDMPDGVTSVGDYAFAYSGLASCKIGKGLAAIPENMFYGCSKLETVTIPRNVKSIGADAFAGCGKLSLVKVNRGETERVSQMLKDSGFDVTGLTFEELIVPYYTIIFHRYDGSDEQIAAYDFDYGVAMPLPDLNELGWARRGFKFKGWATSQVNAANGKVWKADGAWIKDGTAEGKTLSIYALWK